MAGFLGRGIGAAAGGYFSGGVLGIQAQQKQREKDQDQALRQAQIDSLNAQRNASQKDPHEGRKKFADAFLSQMLKDDFDPNMQSALRTTRGVRESREAARKYISEFYTDKRDWSEFDPSTLSGIAASIDQLRAAPQPDAPVLGATQAVPPLGAAEAASKLASEQQGSPGLAMLGGRPQLQLPDIGRAGIQPPSTMGPFRSPTAPTPAAPFAYEKQVGSGPLGAGGKSPPVTPTAAPRPTQRAAPPTPERLLEENNARANAYYQSVLSEEPTEEQVVAEMPYDTPKEQRAELERRTDRWHKRVTQAYQQTQAFNKQAEGESAAKAAPGLNAATLRSRLASAGLAEAQIEQIINPESLANQVKKSGIEARKKAAAAARERNRIAARAQEGTQRHQEAMRLIAQQNANTSRKQADTSAAAQAETVKRNKRLNGHLDWLENKAELSPLLREKLRNARANRVLVKDPISGVSTFIVAPGTPENELATVMQEVERELSKKRGGAGTAGAGAGAASLGGGGAGNTELEADVAQVASLKGSGGLKALGDRLRAANDTAGLARLRAAIAEHDRRKKTR
jgi:hypothetical protein